MEAPRENRSLQLEARNAAVSAAIGAALLLYFGFVHLAAPTGNDLFSQSWRLLYHTLRIGGLVMAAVTIWLWTGHPRALLADGIVSGVIGSILVLTGIGMLVDGGDMTQSLINVVCGSLFFSAGLHNAKIYLRRQPERASFLPTPSTPDRPLELSNAAQFRKDRSPQAPVDVVPNERDAPIAPQEPPAEGYLASLAKKRDG